MDVNSEGPWRAAGVVLAVIVAGTGGYIFGRGEATERTWREATDRSEYVYVEGACAGAYDMVGTLARESDSDFVDRQVLEVYAAEVVVNLARIQAPVQFPYIRSRGAYEDAPLGELLSVVERVCNEGIEPQGLKPQE